MVAYLVGGVYNECKMHVSNDVDYLAQSIQTVFQCTVKFTVIPAKTAKLLKLNIWNDFVHAVENSVESGKIFFILKLNKIYNETSLCIIQFFFKHVIVLIFVFQSKYIGVKINEL